MRSRLLLVAVSALLTACGARTTAAVSAAVTVAAPANCRTADLTWTLTLLTADGTATPDAVDAELAAVNPGTLPCALAGYPKLEFHQGKGPQARGSGEGGPGAVALGAGGKAVFALRWPGPDDEGRACTPRVTTGAATVAAPGEAGAVRVPVTDRAGHPAEAAVCGRQVRMGPPATR